MRNFEELRVWQDARLLVNDIYKMTATCKDYGFKDQIQRAAVSIMNNIAEGSESGSDPLFVRYLKIAKASCGEVRSMLFLCEDLHYCSADTAISLKNRAILISSSIQKLIEYLNKSNNQESKS
ncbi:S23 ribosomal protein [Paludibacter propionicigenes WB4]|uniref:S23 ribosomal protein n=1 Tax=Paludibacter propionicigenes (strain DSM 17365 / JCM 13257 / WB4) TaxID=694427 RepID=E4T398_PALPW|nr:four helix bundle protein [Paludibacter propionicigenes]ADQ79192.1 S23 ribosomal protein [Paludibacter propionicigenes WB4]